MRSSLCPDSFFLGPDQSRQDEKDGTLKGVLWSASFLYMLHMFLRLPGCIENMSDESGMLAGLMVI